MLVIEIGAAADSARAQVLQPLAHDLRPIDRTLRRAVPVIKDRRHVQCREA